MSIFRRVFRPGSGGKQKGVSIVDTQVGRAATRNPFSNRTREEASDPEGSFWPAILTNEVKALGPHIPTGSLPGTDEQGNMAAYEADDPVVLNRLFGVEMPDE